MRVVPVFPRSIDDYREIVAHDVITSLQRVAWERAGLRVLHINSTEYGGGVAEVLLAQIPLMQDLGLVAQWGVIDGDERFFEITKELHNGIQGNTEIPWNDDKASHYLQTLEHNLEGLPGGYDVVVVHDPQPLGIAALLGDRRTQIGKHWIWRCHIDCAEPHPEIWNFLNGQLDPYDAAVFTMAEYVQPDMPVSKVVISPPSIDPLSPKNAPLADITVRDICLQYKVDVTRPLMAQVSRFDPWKDPLGVIRAYRIVKEEIADVQLLLAGSLAHDDPEGLRYYDTVLQECADDPDLHVLSNFHQVGNTAVNCFQRAADVVIQKSTREGFGLTVSEAAWKAKPVIGGAAGGITLQIVDGETGYLVDSVEACAQRSLDLFGDPERASTMGRAAREYVRERFLTTREVDDWLRLFSDIVT